MKITARSEYGSRAMVELAVHWDRGLVSLHAVAERQRIPKKFLEQVVTQLRHAQLVEAFRGASGGYRLSRPPSRISLLEILEALEGHFSLMECQTGPGEMCGFWGSCGLRDAWSAAEDSARRVLGETTLETLAQRQLARERRPASFTTKPASQ